MVGSTLAHYRIDAELGKGGMGVVYRAFDQKLHRDVALKVLRQDVVGRGHQRDRVLAEARAAARLNHPGVATVYEVGEQDELVFIVMELVSGVELRRQIEGGSLRAQALARIGTQVSDALAAAHSRNVVHGDVKPENIVIQHDGRIKLLDFGLARQSIANLTTGDIMDARAATADQEVLGGTLAYMAPEKLRGDLSDPRSDLFSLGVLLYEMATGARPFDGPSPRRLQEQILHDSVSTAELDRAETPADLRAMILRLLEKDPDERYQSARDVAVDLTNVERDLELGPTLAAAVAGRRTVAVLPFRLLTPNPDDEYLGLAVADSLINGLSVSDQLLLRPTSSVVGYAGKHPDPLFAARELNVSVIVEGSIQKVGPQLRAHVQVWGVDGSALLSTKHDGELSDLFALQDQIAERLYDTLGVPSATREVPPTRDPRAYELYLRAIERLSHNNRWDTRTAIEMLRAVTGLDPDFADAWAMLGLACVNMAFSFDPDESWYASADEAIERALVLDPANVEARVAKGRALWSPGNGFQNRPALQALGEALRLNPRSHPAIVWRSLIFLHVGLFEEAHRGLTEALAIEPDDPRTLNFLGQAREFLGDYDAAKDYQDRTLAIDPGFLYAHLFRPSLLFRNGELEQAERAVQTGEKIIGRDKMLISVEALIWAERGDATRAETLVGSALDEASTLAHTHHAWHNVAAVYALLGKPEKAVEYLDRAARWGLPNYPLFRDDPLLQPLREDRSYQQLLASLRLDWETYRQEFVG